MSEKPDVDEGFERLLSALLREEISAPDRECPAPGVLAAYFEKNLDPSEVELTDAHVAGCRACQELMAALVRIDAAPPPTAEAPAPVPAERAEPVVVAPPVGVRRRWRWEWIAAPFAVAATAVVALTITYRSGREFGAAPPRRADQDEPGGPSAESAAVAKTEENRQVAPAPGSALKGDREENPEQATTSGAAARPDLSSPSADAASTHPRAAGEAPSAPAAKADVGAAGGGPPSAEAAASARRPSVAYLTDQATDEGSAVVFAARSDPRIAWRLHGNSIERSDDGGATWRLQAADVASGLLAGSAPDGEVSWACGHDGVVLRSTDGEHWDRVESPTENDLVEIVARSANTAFVKDASGRRFVTRDGGRSWIAL